MSGLWVASHVVLWILVLIELVCIIALARQVGVLSVRIGPTGARTMNVGPDIGIAAPPILALDINGREVTLGTVRGRRTLLAFVSPVCSTCARVVRGLNALWHSERDLDIILVSNNDYDIAEVRAFAEEHHVTALPYVVDIIKVRDILIGVFFRGVELCQSLTASCRMNGAYAP